MLLKANPEAAKHRYSDDCNLLHAAIDVGCQAQLSIDVMRRIHAIHKDAVREVDSEGWLPVHYAAFISTVEVMEFLLGLYPESASVVTSDDSSHNLLRLAVYNNESTTSVMEAKVRFLCSRYPAMALQRDSKGDTPLLGAFGQLNVPAVQILCEAGGQEQIRLPIAHPTDGNYKYNGWLPLHCLIKWNAESLRESLFSKEADYFRLLLRWYPEAAGIEGGVDEDDEDEDEDEDEEDAPIFRKTPYQLAVDENLPPYYLRLLLRAAPDLNPIELQRLNYAERRMAMFVTFNAVTSQLQPLLLKRLRFENKDLVKHVVSFL